MKLTPVWEIRPRQIDIRCGRPLPADKKGGSMDIKEALAIKEKYRIGYFTDELRQADEVLHSHVRQSLNAQDELPKKRQVRYEDTQRIMGKDGEIKIKEQHITYSKEDESFNAALDLCQPILAKKNARIAELEQALDNLTYGKWTKLEEDLSKAKAKLVSLGICWDGKLSGEERIKLLESKLTEAKKCIAELEAGKVSEGEIEKVIFSAIRYGCAADKCDKTCPAFSNKNDCGIWKMAKLSTHAIAALYKRKD